MDDQQNDGMNDEYPVQYNVDYKDGTRNRLTTLFRWILMIPSLVVLALAGGLILATLPMILFRKKYPRWFFDYQLQYAKFSARVTAYASLQMDEYPSTDDEQSAQLDITYPDAEAELNRFLPLVKWILAIPHFIVIYILSIISAILTIIAWFAIIITGRYPKALFDFNVGVSRWTYRVAAYAFLLTTDRYPPFSLNQRRHCNQLSQLSPCGVGGKPTPQGWLIGRPIDIIDRYPVQLVVEYGDGNRNRLTTTFRWVLAIPLLILALAAGVGHITFAPALMILFRKRYPHWMFHHQLALAGLEARIIAYVTFLVDEYPSANEPQSVHLDMQCPDDATRLRRFLPLFKWFLATPHYFVLLVLFAIAVPVIVIAWLAILITGRYPQWLFNYIVGTMRWALRVTAYALFLVTDRYPPFRFSS